MRRRALLLGAALLIGLPLVGAALAEARPGGGHGYSSGSSGSSGGGGGGSSGSSYSSGSSSSSSSSSSWSSSSGSSSSSGGPPGAFFAAVLVIFVGFMGFALVTSLIESRGDQEWEAHVRRLRALDASTDTTDELALLREKDPAFTLALFEDFARALFARAHQARHDKAALDHLAPYLDPLARKQLLGALPAGVPVTSVVIGTMSVGRWRLDGVRGRFRVLVEFEANLTAGGETRVVTETWSFERSQHAKTRTWEGLRTFGCPSCGDALEKVAEELCASCGQAVRPGRFDWSVLKITEGRSESVDGSLRGTVPERGTEKPTIVDARLRERTADLLQEDPQALTGLEARLKLIFAELNAAWAAQDLRPARGFLSSGLYHTMEEQLKPYLEQGLVNAVRGARIVKWEMARLLRDRDFDSLTLRVFGTGADHTYEKA
ncbi:MAG TPA: hypothetical protein VFM29_09105, partial [Vicinamibacteria bacterium]|nr:hypothetical protein [Vicinamibacteria bacterium]